MHFHRHENEGTTFIRVTFVESDVKMAALLGVPFVTYFFEQITRAIGETISVLDAVKFEAYFEHRSHFNYAYENKHTESFAKHLQWIDQEFHERLSRAGIFNFDYETYLKEFATKACIRFVVKTVEHQRVDADDYWNSKEFNEKLRAHLDSLRYQKTVVKVERRFVTAPKQLEDTVEDATADSKQSAAAADNDGAASDALRFYDDDVYDDDDDDNESVKEMADDLAKSHLDEPEDLDKTLTE